MGLPSILKTHAKDLNDFEAEIRKLNGIAMQKETEVVIEVVPVYSKKIGPGNKSIYGYGFEFEARVAHTNESIYSRKKDSITYITEILYYASEQFESAESLLAGKSKVLKDSLRSAQNAVNSIKSLTGIDVKMHTGDNFDCNAIYNYLKGKIV